jgi:hypothetical protein
MLSKEALLYFLFPNMFFKVGFFKSMDDMEHRLWEDICNSFRSPETNKEIPMTYSSNFLTVAVCSQRNFNYSQMVHLEVVL